MPTGTPASCSRTPQPAWAIATYTSSAFMSWVIWVPEGPERVHAEVPDELEPRGRCCARRRPSPPRIPRWTLSTVFTAMSGMMIFPLSAGVEQVHEPGRTLDPQLLGRFFRVDDEAFLGHPSSRPCTRRTCWDRDPRRWGTFAGSIFSTKPAARTTGQVASVISTTSKGGSSWPRAATSFDSRLRGLPVTNSTLPPSASNLRADVLADAILPATAVGADGQRLSVEHARRRPRRRRAQDPRRAQRR